MDRNTLVAFLLIGLILIFYPVYIQTVSPNQKNTTNKHVEKGETRRGHTDTWAQQKENKKTNIKFTQAPLPDEKILTIKTNLYTAKLSNIGGGSFVSFKLKNYFLKNDSIVNLIDSKNKRNLYIRYFSVSGEPTELNNPWNVATPNKNIDVNYESKEVRFYQEINGRRVEKSLTFHPDSYIIDINLQINELSDIISLKDYSLSWEGGIPQTENNPKDELTYFGGFVYQAEKPYTFDKLSKPIKNDPTYWGKISGKTDWVAVRSKYFLSALIPEGGSETVEVNLKKTDQSTRYSYRIHLSADTQNQKVALYLGPLEYKTLKNMGNDIPSIMNFGIAPIRPISKGVLWLLKFLHQFIPNYGIVLVLFSILIKIVVYPLTKKSYQSTKEMQAVQPLVAALREKHKKDPAKLNKATMALYKEHGVNPLGGCLPLLLQMPLLFALFQVFRSTIELRNAPFFWWIKDLSSPDIVYNLPFSLPLYGDHIAVLPIVMGFTMFLQQKMMPTQASGQQKFMSYFMTGFFILLFNNFPSGLNLYYTLFNVFTILQQKFLTQTQS